MSATPAAHPLSKKQPAPRQTNATPEHRHWSDSEVEALFAQPFMDLLWQAQSIHRQHFNANEIQRSTLLSIKTGGCSEDCGYCAQSARYPTDLAREKLMPLNEVIQAAQAAKEKGASRFCMGAAWRSPKEHDLPAVLAMVKAVKALGLETCVTLGMLQKEQAEQLAEAGLDYYNHNLDTAADFYPKVIQTHTQQDRLDTITAVRQAGINVCSGGIIGMGETRQHRASLIAQLANLNPAPESVPINHLVAIPGTPMADTQRIDYFEFIRTIAAARITMPRAFVRLSAGRENMSEAIQALCFLAGANSIFYGEKLLTTQNAQIERDDALLNKLNLHAI